MKICTGTVATIFAGLMATSASAYQSFAGSKGNRMTRGPAMSVESLPGALPPAGFFDPLGFAERAPENELKRYREAEVTHGRVAMLATVGFLVGEAVQGQSFLFNGKITGPAITHLAQLPYAFWIIFTMAIARAEMFRAKKGWVEPGRLAPGEVAILRDEYYPGDLGWDPLNLRPRDPEEFKKMQTKELQNGRLAMLAAAGFMAQELANGKGIIENLQS